MEGIKIGGEELDMDKIKIYITIFIMIVLINSCGINDVGIYYSEGSIKVRGYNELRDTLTISPGTKVCFESYYLPIFDFSGHAGELVVKEGGKLIARGTKEKPIVFESIYKHTSDGLYFESSASNESILEYCEFREGVVVNISNSMTVQYCKFFNISELPYIEIKCNSNSLIKNNSFFGVGIWLDNEASPLIQYNSMDENNSTTNGIAMGLKCSPDIQYNNITNSLGAAISRGEASDSSFTVSNNYVANCFGKIGVDTTGIQSYRITYINPQTVPVFGAGCGW